MGCGQSKINIYPRKSKGKNSSKKSAAEKPEGEDEEGGENEQDSNVDKDDVDGKKKNRSKTIGHVGGPLLAQTELSSSQQNFFKMLDEKIENGPDYDSNDETEIALETARLHALLKDWETASAHSRSLPSTPRHGARHDRPTHSAPKSYQRQPPPNVSYRQTYNPAVYQGNVPNATGSPTHQSHQSHQQYVQMQKTLPPINYHDYGYAYGVPRTYVPNTVPTNHGSPVHYGNSSPKHRYPTPMYPAVVNQPQYVPASNSPQHKMYVTPQGYTNGELIIQQLYNQQVVQYQQSREYQHYRQTREQHLMQQQQQQQQQQSGNYQSSVHVPIVSVVPQTEAGVSAVQRKHRQYSHEIT